MSSLAIFSLYTKFRHLQIITCNEDFMTIKRYNALNNEKCINPQFENTLTNYIKADLSTQRYV